MKSKISKIVSAAGFALLTPVVTVFANTNSGAFASGGVFDNFIAFLKRILTSAFPIITALLIVLFGYQVILFLTDKEVEKKEIHKGALIKSLIAIFLWFTIFGLITVLAKTVGVKVGDTVTSQNIPTVSLP
ncbi:MAG TPA: hypothetical protein PKZ56_00640 [Candidatus Paceibacterota bacterium]|nr:hypothetical protein [Candidatus Paceibacterota bacterium]